MCSLLKVVLVSVVATLCQATTPILLKEAAMDYHDKVRTRHQVPLLQWSLKLTKKAVAKCPGRIACANDTDVAACLDAPYRRGSECYNYVTGKARSSSCSIRPFADMVWRRSRRFGCARCSSMETIACLYAPAFNASTTLSNVVRPPTNYTEEALYQHNLYRLIHQAPPVEWSKELEVSAQKWVDNCEFEHSSLPYGENLGLGHSSMKSVIDAWYGEVKDYDYNKPVFSGNTGHFTQVVWINTRTIGCALGNCPGMRLWICQYHPPGNYQGQFSANVRPPINATRSSTSSTGSIASLAIIIPIIIMTIALAVIVSILVIRKRQKNTIVLSPTT